MATDWLVDELLFWALESSEGDTTYWMRIQSWVPSTPDASEDAGQRAVSILMGQELVVGKRAITHEVVEFALTPVGVREAGRRFEAVRSRRERLAYAENAILTWVFETVLPSRPVELIDFIGSPAGYFYASKLTAEEVTEAATSLVELKMLTTTGGPLTGVWLAPEGRACVMSGQPVREYMRPHGTHLIQNIHSGGVGAQGLDVHQHSGDQGTGAS
ncbi:hypothetical protein ACFWBB_26320 [Streptomyces sp. NPDC060000]|uniref:hypothetical protein n=1 Tax=Streptomyces sp. NPDC060000 TaxID=3347031 RepID=UPI0036C168AC